jgi:hypothetical protein
MTTVSKPSPARARARLQKCYSVETWNYYNGRIRECQTFLKKEKEQAAWFFIHEKLGFADSR